jgi:hypothetical protein
MKKYTLVLIIGIVLLNSDSFCDIIITDTHFVNSCIKITNADDYPNISFIAYAEGSTPTGNKIYEVSSRKCLKGCRYCKFSIYAVKKDYIADKNIKRISWPKNKNALKSNITIELYPEYLENPNPITSVRQYYKIAGFTNTSLILYKWKEVFKFDDGRQDSTEIYNYEGDASMLSQDF